METIIPRSDIKDYDLYKEIFAAELHDHPIVEDVSGTLRWKRDEGLDELVMGKMNLNDIIIMFHLLGYNKNSEIYRELYRNLGYSLYGYWEIFYWDVNNPIADQYKYNAK